MNKISTKKIALNGVMIALVFLGTYFTRIPTPLPGGYFNLGDAVIIVAAIILGRTSGLVSGAIGSCLADIAFGSFLFAPITLIVKGLEGFVVGWLASIGRNEAKTSGAIRVISVIAGAAIMVFGYFFAEAFILGFADKAFGLTAAVAELVPNSIQGGLIKEMIGSCLKSGNTNGVLSKVDFRYLMQKNSLGTKIVFADRTEEIDRLSSLIRSSALVGTGSLVAFYFISLFLAGWAVKPIEKSLLQQRQFVADASHELKTPLTVILANTDIVLSSKEKTVAQQQKWIDYIKIEAQRMTSLVNNLLFLAKADDNINNVVFSEINLSDTVWSCILPFESHIPIAIAAMKAGKYVAMEVGGAYSLDDCWELVRTSEETGMPCMLLENCCYGRREMMVLNMVKKGIMGDIIHCSGGYCHDLRQEIANGKENRHYRLRNYLNRNCDNYPTHELGPISKVLNINHGNRMVSLISVASRSQGLHDYIVANKGAD